MSEPIRQELGFDAAQALAELAKLDQVLQSTDSTLNKFAQDLRDFNKIGRDTARVLGTLNKRTGGTTNSPLGDTKAQTAQANALIDSANKIGPAVERNMRQAARSTRELTISWETMSRVVVTQLIVRTMSQIRDAFRASVREALEFERAIARVTTIAPGTSIAEAGVAARNLSDEFNIDLLDSTAGLYQALGNQVGDFAESLEFSATAARFAKATNAELKDSVDLISGALKSFNLDVTEAERLASIFFVAIDEGRIEANELANTFGRVGPAASQIGIGIEEIAGALAQISVQGTKTSETLTQFRGIVIGLTKPSEAMQAALQQMGFATVEQAIQTRGLSGLLNDLADSTSGSARALAKLFPNVRGLGGALGLTGENLRFFASNIETARDITGDFINEKFDTVFGTQAEQLTGSFNKLKNAITTEFGTSVVQTGNDLIAFAGGIENVINFGRAATPAVVKLGVAVGGLAISLKGASFAAGLLRNNLAGVTTAGLLTAISAA
ncbi:MAG: phage tail tape measure protein, partial [Pirellulales bacterium]